MMEQRNLVLTIVLSLLILLGFQYFYERPRLLQQQAQQQAAEQLGQQTKPVPTAQSAEPATPPETPAEKIVDGERDRATVIAEGARVRVDTPRVEGSINLTGGRLDDYTLKNYHETVDPTSPDVTLLNPLGAADAYYAEFGWTSADKSIAMPDRRPSGTDARSAGIADLG